MLAAGLNINMLLKAQTNQYCAASYLALRAKENDATSENSFSLSFFGHLGKYNFVLGSTIY